MPDRHIDRKTTADVILMFSAMVFFLASLFGTMALFLLIWVAANDEGIHPIAALAVVLMLVMGVWNLVASVRLFNAPNISSFAWIVGRSLIALCPIFLASIFLK